MRNLNEMTKAEVIDQIARYEAQIAVNRERWADADVSDSALSSMAANCGLAMARTRLKIIQDGGASFPVLLRDGVVVADRISPGKWGAVWIIKEEGKKWEFIPFGREARYGCTTEDRILPAVVGCSNTWTVTVSRAPEAYRMAA